MPKTSKQSPHPKQLIVTNLFFYIYAHAYLIVEGQIHQSCSDSRLLEK
uniref:Uncharacterized protein n=1 Tax=Arundo donax TaxID=35708 RepID=A0A0A9AZZ1_ARUDO